LPFPPWKRNRSPAVFGPNLPVDRSENNSLVGFSAVARPSAAAGQAAGRCGSKSWWIRRVSDPPRMDHGEYKQ
jgi:hypothetical protein